MRILLVEDEPKIREVLAAYLKNEGWEVDFTPDGNEALALFRSRAYDLVILDLMLEGLPGEEVCREIRQSSFVPIVMITSKSRESDAIIGLNLGADDYIVKPFRVKEVVARIHALLRRTRQYTAEAEKNAVMSFDKGRLVLEPETGTVLVRGVPVSLTATELKLLCVLASKPGKVFARNDLTYEVLGYRFQGESRTIDTHLKNLRKKIEEDPKEPQYVLTMIGSGYKLAAALDGKEP
ncbi:response regulator transcription factor [Paenibacillus thalictri]|uniref:Response regulator transcription factor n=1 Tax=Paenibacillus thalictri TaxID=2527873 RepID=A0A4Q9DH42_9BACL|nr:response regulator transcription factor [Paenibacillus thalictri]TBL71614.1 response regulator transcription factor [Paenibacillus thalictri]